MPDARELGVPNFDVSETAGTPRQGTVKPVRPVRSVLGDYHEVTTCTSGPHKPYDAALAARFPGPVQNGRVQVEMTAGTHPGRHSAAEISASSRQGGPRVQVEMTAGTIPGINALRR